MKRLLVFVFFLSCLQGLQADPCALVNDPRNLQLIDLKNVAQFLEEDLDMGKGITEVIGKTVIDRRFRNAGIPDPVKSPLKYGIVAREMPVDQLNLCFVLQGDLDAAKFLEFAEKRYDRYFTTLKAQKLVTGTPKSKDTTVAGKPARLFPFAFRQAEAVVTYFPGCIIISTVPAGDYALIAQTIAVLEGKAPAAPQPEKIGFMASFVPNEQERTEIRTFENRYEGFAAKTRKSFKKAVNRQGYENEEAAARVEQQIKDAMSGLTRFSYEVGARREGGNYAYDVNMIFRCASPAKAEELKSLLLTWLAYTSSKVLSDEDMVSIKANQVGVREDSCVYTIRLGSTPEEQYQFSSLVLSLMMQDRRFNSIFKG